MKSELITNMVQIVNFILSFVIIILVIRYRKKVAFERGQKEYWRSNYFKLNADYTKLAQTIEKANSEHHG